MAGGDHLVIHEFFRGAQMAVQARVAANGDDRADQYMPSLSLLLDDWFSQSLTVCGPSQPAAGP